MEVRTKRVGVNPMLEKDQPQRILGIVVDRLEQASRFLSGALHVLQLRARTRSMVSARAWMLPVTMSTSSSYRRGRNGERATRQALKSQ